MPSPTVSSRVLLITSEPIDVRLAGPAIRVWQMARALANEGHEVTVASTGGVTRSSNDFVTATFEASNAEALVDNSDLVIFQGSFYSTMPWLAAKPQVQVMDLYDPFHIEFLQTEHGLDDEEAGRRLAHLTADLNAQLGRADLVLCANEQQRDLWMGHLAALGRLRPAREGSRHAATLQPTALDELVIIVPFGTSDDPFAAHAADQPVIRTAARGISATDVVLIWAGGIYDWFDPLTLIRAVARASVRVPTLRLFFLSSATANSSAPVHRGVSESLALARELGVLDSHVFFNDTWVDYEKRALYLAEADAGVTTHYRGLETRFSFRTRNLDYLWANLPIVTSAGDSFAALVQNRDAGAVVEPGDVDAMADALVLLATDSESRRRWSANSASLGQEMTWRNTLAPLLRFAQNPARSTVPTYFVAEVQGGGIIHDLKTAFVHLRSGGFRKLCSALRGRRARDSLRNPTA